MTVTLFYASVSGNQEVKKQQQRIMMVLDGCNIPYNLVDICQSNEDKELMRKLVGDSKALPPQICNGNDYCGDFKAFENAVEMETLKQFLKLQ
ncbi:SH3 domain-binding glutamic acid-rich-like protein 3 [Takifugu rubripes]|uniref:SH3 domain-binding glutamic acid-rich-like protein n=1 Tax=Takifugu rubripes TaxID=31033 RepID=A0A3B5KTB6_TAKRU|nr:SH3 domain-binding glutamic acid-rich-like protein 3 [Takifugu rubripes]|eukprot:XP_003971708.1 PREDICTED: SH3 domain-binding glutamic acid-rich-like protein 3 [Takifugu rubripes]